jgi:deoxyhypusine synthase
MKLNTVRDMHLQASKEIADMVKKMRNSGGFMGKNLADAATIFSSMVLDKKCLKMLSFPADIVATGLRGVLIDMVKKKMINTIITTCGTIDHDIARTYSEYFQGSFYMDDIHLREKGFHRLGNILIPEKSYGPTIEEKVQPILEKVYSSSIKKVSPSELCRMIGEELGKESLLYWCNKMDVPVFVPGIVDGAVGSQIWLFCERRRDFQIDVIEDERKLADLVFSSGRRGGLVIGGGISKHHLIWWNQFKGGLDYACYITTAVEYDGSLSGAHVREAISWGKVKPNSKNVTVFADATIALPIIYTYALYNQSSSSISE